jgi:hypothetical protein
MIKARPTGLLVAPLELTNQIHHVNCQGGDEDEGREP